MTFYIMGGPNRYSSPSCSPGRPPKAPYSPRVITDPDEIAAMEEVEESAKKAANRIREAIEWEDTVDPDESSELSE